MTYFDTNDFEYQQSLLSGPTTAYSDAVDEFIAHVGYTPYEVIRHPEAFSLEVVDEAHALDDADVELFV